MAEALIAVMLVAGSLYTVLGGADFGAGIVEGVMGKKARERVDVALAPVWEANHVWLILIVVILFVGFPRLYTLLSIHLHIPIVFALLGIVARGSAFTFRHYDPTATFDRWYTAVFRFASLLAPLSLGLVLAATAAGTLPSAARRRLLRAVHRAVEHAVRLGDRRLRLHLVRVRGRGAARRRARARRRAAAVPAMRRATRSGSRSPAGALVLIVAWLQELAWLRQLFASAVGALRDRGRDRC